MVIVCRLAFSVVWEMTPSADVVDVKYCKTVIKSQVYSYYCYIIVIITVTILLFITATTTVIYSCHLSIILSIIIRLYKSGFISSVCNPLVTFKGQKRLKMCIAGSQQNPISQLRDVTCHMGSHRVTCHPTQVNAPHLNPSQ